MKKGLIVEYNYLKTHLLPGLVIDSVIFYVSLHPSIWVKQVIKNMKYFCTITKMTLKKFTFLA